MKVMKMINIIRANPLIFFHMPITVLSTKHLLQIPNKKIHCSKYQTFTYQIPHKKSYIIISFYR